MRDLLCYASLLIVCLRMLIICSSCESAWEIFSSGNHMYESRSHRLAALALRLALDELISRGCTERRLSGAPAVSVLHDEAELNRHVPVPGLAERAAFQLGHPWAQQLRHSPK